MDVPKTLTVCTGYGLSEEQRSWLHCAWAVYVINVSVLHSRCIHYWGAFRGCFKVKYQSKRCAPLLRAFNTLSMNLRRMLYSPMGCSVIAPTHLDLKSLRVACTSPTPCSQLPHLRKWWVASMCARRSFWYREAYAAVRVCVCVFRRQTHI